MLFTVQEYQQCFHKTKRKLEEMPNERQFEFSEMYIFGKFDTFVRRCKKIIDVFNTLDLYCHLSESRIEGIKWIERKLLPTAKRHPVVFCTITPLFDVFRDIVS